jgi:hypothetical protein
MTMMAMLIRILKVVGLMMMLRAQNQISLQSGRPGFDFNLLNHPGVTLRFTPGFMPLAPHAR